MIDSNGQKLSLLNPQINRILTHTKQKIVVSLVADFETTTVSYDCRVWAWGLANIEFPNKVEYGTNLDSFIERISHKTTHIYFHNLKFDGHFIIDWLFRHDYFHVADAGLDDISPHCFKTLIDSGGKYYSVTVKWKTGYTTEFRDSLKKLPMSVKRIAESFKLEESKGELDYHKSRPLGHKLTLEEIDYLRKDVSIVANAMKEVFDNGMTKLTVASDSMAEYKRLIGRSNFNKYFPLFAENVDAEIRRALRGGYTYADSRFSKRVVGSGIALDVNGLYSFVMRNLDLPYGEYQYISGKVDSTDIRPLTIFSVTFTAKIKPNHIPCIQVKGTSFFQQAEYQTIIDTPTTLVVTNVDWELYNDHYDIQILEYGGGYSFQSMKGMFDLYVDKWAAIKATSEGGKREIAKLHLNSLYGKFASNPDVTGKIPIMKDDVVKLIRGPISTRPPVYTALGVFVTAYARDITIRAAQDNYNTFAYADTDSLHLLQDIPPESLDIHPTRLGAWKLEYHFKSAFYIRPKAYLEQKDDGTFVNRMAGLPEKISNKFTFDSLIDGEVFHGKLNPKSVPGGIVLKEIPWKLKIW